MRGRSRNSTARPTGSISPIGVFVGYERRIIGGLSRRVEVGYVFSRRLEYQSIGQEIGLGDTLMVRGGLTY